LAVASAVSADEDLEALQVRLNVREIFSSRKFPSMIAALKLAIALYANDPEWARSSPTGPTHDGAGEIARHEIESSEWR
jgi:hypothetical protein